MATQAYYRKWRSQTFAELVGQEHVTRTLLNAVRAGRVAHAYVFSGPRGVGKTSAARLLAKAVNCEASVDGEPCNQCSSCRAIAEGRALDVVELDAASNRGIDEIRDLREKVNFAPSESRYKFYILDEAHMLTTEAVNAFLKTLEEPPAHTVFVLATTEAHRLPATILSRCQRLDFRRISLPAMLGRLRQICQAEGVEVEPAALEIIARAATGSLRDAEGLLDQVVAYAGSSIGVEQVRSIVGLGGSEAARQLLEYLASGDLAGGLRLINQLVEAGADPRHFGRELVDYLRGLMMLKAGESLAELLDVTSETLAQMSDLARRLSTAQVLQCLRIFAQSEPPARGVTLGQLPLEMAFVEASLALAASAPAEPAARPPVAPRPLAERTTRPAEVAAPARPPVQARPRGPELSSEPTRGSAPAVGKTADATVAEAGASTRPAPGYGEATLAEPTRGLPEASAESAPAPAPAAGRAERRGRAGESRRPRLQDDGPALTLAGVDARWKEVREQFRGQSIFGLLSDVWPVGVDGTQVVLACRFSFHKERLDREPARTAVETTLSQVLGRRCQIRTVTDSGAPPRGEAPSDTVRSAASDSLIKMATSMGYRVTRIEKDGEILYDAESQDDTAAPGQAGQDPGGAG